MDFDQNIHTVGQGGGFDVLRLPVFERAATRLPVLRKDFMYDTYQVAEARAHGADCILIIMAALRTAPQAILKPRPSAHGMDVLIEIHDRSELDRALKLRSPMIGVNKLTSRSFETKLETSEALAPLIPKTADGGRERHL